MRFGVPALRVENWAGIRLWIQPGSSMVDWSWKCLTFLPRENPFAHSANIFSSSNSHTVYVRFYNIGLARVRHCATYSLYDGIVTVFDE